MFKGVALLKNAKMKYVYELIHDMKQFAKFSSLTVGCECLEEYDENRTDWYLQIRPGRKYIYIYIPFDKIIQLRLCSFSLMWWNIYFGMYVGYPFSTRDFVLARHDYYHETQSVCCGFSTVRADKPPTKQYVRGNVFGMLIVPII